MYTTLQNILPALLDVTFILSTFIIRSTLSCLNDYLKPEADTLHKTNRHSAIHLIFLNLKVNYFSVILEDNGASVNTQISWSTKYRAQVYYSTDTCVST
jgi:hypothetical protein